MSFSKLSADPLDVASIHEGGLTRQDLRVVVREVAPNVNGRAAAALLALLQGVARRRAGGEEERRAA